jgi:hypothetical protein
LVAKNEECDPEFGTARASQPVSRKAGALRSAAIILESSVCIDHTELSFCADSSATGTLSDWVIWQMADFDRYGKLDI